MIAELPLTLSELKVSETARVRELTGPDSIRRRLSEMGLTAGSDVRMVRVAPLGDPIQINVRDYHLCLRRSEGRCVVVERSAVDAHESDIVTNAVEPTMAPRTRWMKRLGAWAFLFFAIKGMLWLLVPLILIKMSQ